MNRIGEPTMKIPKSRLYSEREVIQALLLVGTGMLILQFLVLLLHRVLKGENSLKGSPRGRG